MSVLIIGFTAPFRAQQTGARIDVSRLGPQVGRVVPDFRLQDAQGKVWTRNSLMGPKGAMLGVLTLGGLVSVLQDSTHVTSSQHRIEFVHGDSDHHVTPDDAAAHSTLAENGETAEHLSFDEVRPIAQRSADAVREPFVVCHGNRCLSY